MKKILLMLAIIATTTLAFGQKSKAPTTTFNIGAAVLFPSATSVDTKTPSYGESFIVTRQQSKHVAISLSASYLQNKYNTAQIPVLAGVHYMLIKNLYVGGELGVDFYTGSTQFAYSPSVSFKIGRVTLNQRFMTTIAHATSTSSVGFGVSYRL